MEGWVTAEAVVVAVAMAMAAAAVTTAAAVVATMATAWVPKAATMAGRGSVRRSPGIL